MLKYSIFYIIEDRYDRFMNNYNFNVFEKVTEEKRKDWFLYIDAIYKADPTKKNKSAEVISKLMGVKNQGGFRYRGNASSPSFVVLFTSGEDVYWRDEFDSSIGVLIYYGDNKIPGTDLHKTKMHGNEILRYIFDIANSDDIEKRKLLPPVFVFKKVSGNDMKFLGLAVPGMKGKPKKDWLTAVWGCNKNGDRFQNYKSFFTILNTDSGSEFNAGFGINLAWINDIETGKAFESKYAPIEWKKYIENKNYSPLFSRKQKFISTKEEQLPSNKQQLEMLRTIQSYFIEKDRGYSFEKFAADMIKYMDSSVLDVNVTRPYKDGGFDAEGTYKVFSNAENVVYVNFYLQAKCYNFETTSITVKDTARLISRIKDRQFGILFTTSYISKQAYEEILLDKHPIVFINGKNIIDCLLTEFELFDKDMTKKWLIKNY